MSEVVEYSSTHGGWIVYQWQQGNLYRVTDPKPTEGEARQEYADYLKTPYIGKVWH